MPPKPRPGYTVTGNNGTYEIKRILNEGNMSWSLEALNLNTGEKAFLKYYFWPTPSIPWYDSYIDYLGELNRRLDESSASQYCMLCQDRFEASAHPAITKLQYLFQAYEFIEAGQDLMSLLETGNPPWEKRKGIAKFLLVAMKKIHDAKIVHCDLKPENIQLVPKKDTTLGFILFVSGMDYSIMEDKSAPWTIGEDKEGYVGTPGYLSPEHLRGEMPACASDVFTIGVILSQLLCGQHPFNDVVGDADEYKKAVLAGGQYAKPLSLMGDLGNNHGNAGRFAGMLERCLSPHAADRPTCAELHKALLDLDKLPPLPETGTDTEGEEDAICLQGRSLGKQAMHLTVSFE